MVKSVEVKKVQGRLRGKVADSVGEKGGGEVEERVVDRMKVRRKAGVEVKRC